jgi:hypothetical protein
LKKFKTLDGFERGGALLRASRSGKVLVACDVACRAWDTRTWKVIGEIDDVEEDDGSIHYVFGRLDQATVSFTTRLNYTITPTLSLQLYGQPFVSSGDYEHYKELVNGRAVRYADRYAPYAHRENEDFTVLSFRTTNVLRWEFKPGSTLFVVWQQAREGDGVGGRFRFRRDFGDVFSTGAANTLLVKFAYWVNP